MEIQNFRKPIKDEYILNQLLAFQEAVHETYYNDDALYSRNFRKKEMMDSPPPHLFKEYIIAKIDDLIVGRGLLIHWGGEEDANANRCFITIDVLPNYRHQHIATRILQHIKLLAEQNGFTVYEAWIKSNIVDNPAIDWVKRLGGKKMLVERKNRLYRKNIDMEKLENWLSQLQNKSEYEIRKYNSEEYIVEILKNDHFANSLVDFYNEVDNMVPRGESSASDRRLTLDQLRIEATAGLKSNWDKKRYFAFDGSKPIGVTSVYYPMNEDLEQINTGLTAVIKSYQKQGLASLLKLEMILDLCEKDFVYIETENAKGNIAMNVLNTKLGFKEAYQYIAFEGKISEITTRQI